MQFYDHIAHRFRALRDEDIWKQLPLRFLSPNFDIQREMIHSGTTYIFFTGDDEFEMVRPHIAKFAVELSRRG